MLNLFQLSTLCFFITTCIWFKEAKDAKAILKHSNELKIVNDSICIEHSERLLNYTLISLKQNDIINTYQSSKRLKESDRELQELMQKLN